METAGGGGGPGREGSAEFLGGADTGAVLKEDGE